MASDDKPGVKKQGPYGNVHYGDPGWQSDGEPRYPLDTCDHVRAAISYSSMSKNQKPYTPAQLKRLKSRIRKAAKQCDIDVSDQEALMSEIDQEQDSPEDTDDDVLAAVDSLNRQSVEGDNSSEDQDDSLEDTSDDNQTDSDDVSSEDEEDEDDTDLADSDDESEESGSEEESDQKEDDDSSAGDSSQAEDDDSVEDEDEDSEEAGEETSDGLDSDDSEESEEDDDTNEDSEPADEEDAQENHDDDDDDDDDLRVQLEKELQEKQRLEKDNSRLRNALKQMLAERVVDAKVSLGIVPGEDYQEQVENHKNRSASSLADTLQDLAAWPTPTQSRSGNGDIPPQHEEGPAPTSDKEDGNVTTARGRDNDSAESQKSQRQKAVDGMTGLLTNRIPTRR